MSEIILISDMMKYTSFICLIILFSFITQRLLPVRRPEKMLAGKRFGANEEVIAETEAYFEAKDKSFYKKDIEMLERRWTHCITLEGNYVDE